VSELRPGDSEQARTLLTELRRYSAGHVHALRCDDDEVRAFLARPDLERLTDLGPTTLEHVIRTKRVPLLGDDVAGYVAEYRRYFERNRGADEALVMLDPIPRVVLHPDLGLVAVGADAKAAGAVMDIYRHTIRVIEAAERLGGYRTVTEAQAFGLEYWELEQRRLR
jgi:rhamnose utilization protein RhaD (predicted bifunctional aldolase and dehydrogenase)